MTDNLKITGASARSKTEFAVGLNIFPLDAEDPYTIFLCYDGSQTQPWSRLDANRNLSDMTNFVSSYIGLSDEEYVYFLQEGDIKPTTIKGMGIHADGATKGAGITSQVIGDSLFVSGQDRQLYKFRKNDTWERVPTDDIELGVNQKSLDLDGLAGKNHQDFYVCGKTDTALFFDQELSDKKKSALLNDDDEEYERLEAIRKSKEPKPEGRAYHWDGETWTQIDVEDYFPKTIFVDSKGRGWLGCNKGTILQIERDEDGGFDVDDIEIIEDSRTDIYSITEFKGLLIMASAEGLFAYDEDFDSLDDEIVRIKPRLNTALGGKPSPLKVQAVDDVMFYFDYNLGIYIWDGDKKWTNIPIPPELLERDFKGLK